VSRQPQSSPAQRKESIGELPELEAAAAALREQFLATFRRIRDDRATRFYKEMTHWPSTKQLMRQGKILRGELLFAPNDILFMRKTFAKVLNDLSRNLTQPIETFINNLRLMRRLDIEWMERGAGRIWPLLEGEYPIWAHVACDGQPADQDWRTPGWLEKWPADLPPKALLAAARGGRLDADRTAGVLKLVAEQIKAPMEQAQRSALNNACIQLAQQKEAARQAANAAPKSHSSRPRPWSDSEAKQRKDTGGPTATTVAASSKSKSREPIEDTRADPEVAKDSTGMIEPKTKRGPKANMGFHRAVAGVVRTYGPNWKKRLEQIAGRLDKRTRDLPPPAIWATRNPPARSWKRAVEYYLAVVRKALDYSLKMAAKDTTGKPSQTLDNPR
jgi:hypothetical protein